jgi:hypothetical protein
MTEVWREDLLHHEIRQLGGVISAAIDAGVPRNAFDDELMDDLFWAERWLSRGEFELAEGLLRQAELKVIAVKRAHADVAPAAASYPPFFIRRRSGKSTAFATLVRGRSDIVALIDESLFWGQS